MPEPTPPPALRAGADPEGVLLAPVERVLATMDKDGARRWLRPRTSPGRFLTGRRAVAYGLMLVFIAIPHISVGGKPAILLDVLRREFTFFGTTFVATDTPILLLLVLGICLAVFLVTALFGRVWCGWACPQTVYMEFLFRPLDRLFEGSYQQQAKLDREGGGPRRALKNLVFVAISAFLAHTFLAYFVGWSRLIGYVTSSPFAHPTAFLVVVGVTAAMAFDFIWFREQTCLVACPYGRLQSVLLDRDSLVIGYDRARGEPRAKRKKPRALPVVEAPPAVEAAAVEAPVKVLEAPVKALEAGRAPEASEAEPAASSPEPGSGTGGDCIECQACVTTCPTGIDIRDGLQLECIGCAQCIDACDAIMLRVGQEPGLIRYDSRSQLEDGAPRRTLRPRVLIYAAGLALVTTLFALGVGGRSSGRVTALRGTGRPFAILPSGEISNQIRLKVRNQSEAPRAYRLELLSPSRAQLIAPENPLQIGAGEIHEGTLFVVVAAEAFSGAGSIPCELRISDGVDFEERVQVTLLGPHQ